MTGKCVFGKNCRYRHSSRSTSSSRKRHAGGWKKKKKVKRKKVGWLQAGMASFVPRMTMSLSLFGLLPYFPVGELGGGLPMIEWSGPVVPAVYPAPSGVDGAESPNWLEGVPSPPVSEWARPRCQRCEAPRPRVRPEHSLQVTMCPPAPTTK